MQFVPPSPAQQKGHCTQEKFVVSYEQCPLDGYRESRVNLWPLTGCQYMNFYVSSYAISNALKMYFGVKESNNVDFNLKIVRFSLGFLHY